MSEDTNDVEPRVLTDPDRIRQLAEVHDAEPVVVDRDDGPEEYRLETTRGSAEGDRISWEEFLDRIGRAGAAVLYRPGVTEDQATETFEVVDLEARVVDQRAAEGERVATSDTGGDEPVVVDRAESEPSGREEAGEASVAPAQDSARAPSPATEGLVLDEIHENPVGPDDEYLVFANTGEAAVDLSGWTVRNEAGRTYRFPEGTVLGPDERLTLHSGHGVDDEHDLHWGAEESVWDDMRDTVVVETADGERVIREPYEA